jgi:hypothetical protein
MHADDDFEEVYNNGGREKLLDDDSMSAEEDAFMQGYDEIPEGASDEDGDDVVYDQAFKKKTRRSKRKENIFDEEELEADVLLH